MNCIDLFNNLHGTTVTRDELEKLATLAFDEQQSEVWHRVNQLLGKYPDAKKFQIDISAKVIEGNLGYSLAGVLDDTIEQEALHGIDFIDEGDLDHHEIAALGRVSPKDIYKMITDRIVEAFKQKDTPQYKKTWKARVYGQGYLIPFNFVTKKRYRGVNVLLLTNSEPLENPFYLTFKQIEKLGGQLKKGSKGRECVYYTQLYKIEIKERNINFATYKKDVLESYVAENGIEEKDIQTLPIIRYYNVFNGKDVDGIDFDLDNFKIGYIESELKAGERIEIADLIVKHYPDPAPRIYHGGDRAYYQPGTDKIQMPYLADFDTSQDYYRTLFHELAHSTGSVGRLKRDFSGRFGSKKYAKEELIAEWGSVFLSAEAGIVWHSNSNHVAYMKSWNTALTYAKEDTRFLMRAATQAQKLADFVLQYQSNGDPLYMKYLKPTTEKIEIVKPVKKPKRKTAKKTKEELDKINPKGFDIKPKSVAMSTVLKDVLSLKKYEGRITPRQASILIKHFKDNPVTDQPVEITSSYEMGILKKESPMHVFYDYSDQLELTNAGVEFIKSINGRRESLMNQKNNLALFDGLKAPTSSSKETTSFNKQILLAKKNGISSTEIFSLGKTKGLLKKHIGDHNLTVSGETLKKAMTKDGDHIASFDHFINFPDSINNPVAIFKSKTKNEAFVILTEIKTHKEKPLMVALHINNTFKIARIASVYNRRKTSNYKKWKDEGLVIYANKKSFDALLSGTIPVSQTIKGQGKVTKKTNTTKKLGSNSHDNQPQVPEPKNLKQALSNAKKMANWAISTNRGDKDKLQILKEALNVNAKSSIEEVENIIFELKLENLLAVASEFDWVLTFLIENNNKPAKKLGTVLIPVQPQAAPNTPVYVPPVQQDNIEKPAHSNVKAPKYHNSLVKGLKEARNASKTVENFKLEGALAEFLGPLEKKHQHSLVITLDAPPGSGKTRSVFQFLNMVANSGYNSVFASLEEHPESRLFHEKTDLYIDPSNEDLIAVFGDLPETWQEFKRMIEPADVIAIDSWNKVYEKYKVDFDNDLRKALDGKLIIVIFQRTADGKMRGGSRAAFDGDIILEVVPDADYRNSFLQARKNRYQDTPLNEIGYNIFNQKVINPETINSLSLPAEISI